MRQHVFITLCGSQTPLVASSSTMALDARSIGTSNTMAAGSHNAKNTVTRTYAGVVRSGRKYRRIRRTMTEKTSNAISEKTSDATGVASLVIILMM